MGVTGSGGLMQRAERLVLTILGCLLDPPVTKAMGWPRGPFSSGCSASSPWGRWAPPSTAPSGSPASEEARLSGVPLTPAFAEPGSCVHRGEARQNARSSEQTTLKEANGVRSVSRQARGRRPGPHRQHGRVPEAVPPLRRQPRVVLGRAGQGHQLVPPLGERLRRRLRRGRLRVVLGGTPQRLVQLRGPPPGRAGGPHRDHLGPGRGGGLPAHLLSRAEAQRRPGGQRAPGPRRAPGRPGLRLHGHDARARLHHAGLRPHRGGALGGVRRLQRGGAARPHRGRALQDRRHGQRGPCVAESASLSRRRWTGPSAGCRSWRPSSWPAAPTPTSPWRPGGTSGWTRSVRASVRRAPTSGWGPRIRSSSSTRPAAPASPRGCCTPPGGIRSTPRTPTRSCSTTTLATSTSAPPTSGGSPGTATSSTARWPTGPPPCSSSRPRSTRTPGATGGSSTTSVSTSSTPPRRRFGRWHTPGTTG